MRWSAIALACIGCGAPISNVPFLEEALFLGVLPTSERLHSPPDVLSAPGGDVVLEAAKGAAGDYANLVFVPSLVGDKLQTEEPDRRTETERHWDGQRIVIQDVPETFDVANNELEFFVQADIEADGNGTGDWVMRIDLGPTRGGPWERVSEGNWDGAGQGSFTWDFDAALATLDVVSEDEIGSLHVGFDDHGVQETWERVITADLLLPSGTSVSYIASGEGLLSFSAWLTVHEDGLPRPGYVTVVHRKFDGGYASGAIFEGEEELGFVRCWDVEGRTVHSRGDEGIQKSGDKTACVAGAP